MELLEQKQLLSGLRQFCRKFLEISPCFTRSATLQLFTQKFVALLSTLLPVEDVILIRLPGQFSHQDMEAEQVLAHGFLPQLTERFVPRITERFETGGSISDAELEGWIAQLDPALSRQFNYTILPVQYEHLIGLALFGRQRSCGSWSEEEKRILQVACTVAAGLFSGREYYHAQELYRLVLNSTMDSMSASVYVTDPKTDQILFMNKSMKKTFGVDHPEGKTCWKVLQKGMQQRCPFCPITHLQSEEGTSSFQWEECNTLTGRVYENHDCLIRWIDGSTVHLQQSIDITDSKEFSKEEAFDGLTGLPNRRTGKLELASTLETARREGQPVTVGLYDINLLKEVNDTYGHSEGDRMILLVAKAFQDRLSPKDLLFRLSGDEFIFVFYGVGKADVLELIRLVEMDLKQKRDALHLNYLLEFCYGLLEISPKEILSLPEVLTTVDEAMYEMKRRFHVKQNERSFLERSPSLEAVSFDYDKEYLFDAIAESMDDYLYVCDMKTNMFRYSPNMVEDFGLPGEVMTDAASWWGTRIHEEDRQAFLESNQEIADGRAESHSIEYRAKNRLGEWTWLRCRGHIERDQNGEPAIFAGIITNLGKKNAFDHMTGLLNKYGFEADISNLIKNRPGQPFAIMVLGIDEFKHINDLYDRLFGDEVIRIISQKIQGMLPSFATVYRMDGDEFCILVRDGAPADLQRIYAGIHEHFNHRQEYNGKKYYCTLSAGCALYPQDAQTHPGLLKHAGYSLEYAKSCGKNCMSFFSKEILTHREKSLELIELMRESVDNNFAGFELYYQPQVAANDGAVVGAEALARWRCEKYGGISPFEFIPLLEESGLIIPVGKWIFQQAVNKCREWSATHPDFIMSVNLSYLQVKEKDFIPFMKQTLKDAGLNPANMVVELTESYLVKESSSVRNIFGDIRGLGLKIAMDDFGTGYSSLGILKTSPADIVKIDKTFIKDIKNSHFDATFIRFVVELCHDVQIRVCLEGVETQEEYQIVGPMQLDFIQGYLFGRPVPAEEFSYRYFSV